MNKQRIRLYWHNPKAVKNFGDMLSPIIISALSDKIIKYTPCIPRSNILNLLVYNLKRFQFKIIFDILFALFQTKIMAIGSIIRLSDDKTIVWGSGILYRNDSIKGGNFLAVRGHITRQRLKELGFNPPDIVGDPAILLRRLYIKSIIPIYEYGIIPHYVDYDNVVKKTNELYMNYPIIKLLNEDPYQIINEIRLCKRIFSSSLHGLIVSHSYGIPSIWCKFSDNLEGDYSKFEDYFSSVNISFYKPYEVFNFEVFKQPALIFEQYMEDISLPDNKIIDKICDDLLSIAPFKIKHHLY